MTSQDSKGRLRITDPVPRGAIILFSGSAVPDGYTLCDGNNQTPDLRDRFIVGGSSIGLGSAGGSVSLTTALTHAGMAVAGHDDHTPTQPGNHSNHAVTQPSDHSDHVITQADAHSDHTSDGGHTHNAHTGVAFVAGATNRITAPATHAAGGAHDHATTPHTAHSGQAVDAHTSHSGADLSAHSAHAGFAVDSHSAHSVTNPSTHAVGKHFLLAYCMKT